MNGMISAVVILALAGLAIYLLNRQQLHRRTEYGPSGTSEYRTALAVDECMDRLAAHSEADVFSYTCPRQLDGSFLLTFTLHNATRQPVGTRYSLRLDAGKETVVTLMFLGEAFGYQEPVFPPEMLDEFMAAKLEARHTR